MAYLAAFGLGLVLGIIAGAGGLYAWLAYMSDHVVSADGI